MGSVAARPGCDSLEAALLRLIPRMGCEPVKLSCQTGETPGNVCQHGRAFFGDVGLLRQGFVFACKLLAFRRGQHSRDSKKMKELLSKHPWKCIRNGPG